MMESIYSFKKYFSQVTYIYLYIIFCCQNVPVETWPWTTASFQAVQMFVVVHLVSYSVGVWGLVLYHDGGINSCETTNINNP